MNYQPLHVKKLIMHENRKTKFSPHPYFPVSRIKFFSKNKIKYTSFLILFFKIIIINQKVYWNYLCH